MGYKTDRWRLPNWAAAADAIEGIRQRLVDLAAWRTRPARQIIAELRAEFEIHCREQGRRFR